MGSQYVTKEHPEISANQLAEFLRASPQRRESILRAAKFRSPETSAPRIRYKTARVAIARALASNGKDFKPIFDAKQELQKVLDGNGTKLTDFVVSDCRLSIEAMDAFIGAINKIPLKGITVQLGEHIAPRINIENVAVSARPDVIITAVKPDLSKKIGGILMYFGKETDVERKKTERKEFGLTAATLLFRYAEQHLATRGEPDRALCLSLDVFGQEAHATTSGYKRRTANIEAACREIRRQWAAIEPPPAWPA